MTKLTVNNMDCLVVGGGLLGMFTARMLAGEGLSVAVLEQGELCRESSWAGGGIISPLVPWKYPDAVTELVRWSQARYPQLAAGLLEETGIDPEWTQSGLLLAGHTLDASVRAWLKRFPCPLEEVTLGQMPVVEPAMAADCGPALLLPEVAQIRNPRLGRALARALELQGVALHTHTRVTGLRISADRVQGVTTAGQDFSSDRVVIAGGAWSAQILAQAMPDLPVTPVLGQMIMFAARPGLLRHIVVHAGHYLIPRRDGLVLAGSTLEHTGFDKQTSREARELLEGMALRLVPGLADFRIAGHWAGLRPGTADGIPLIGEHPRISGLFLNTGHFRNGVGMAPAAAHLLVERIMGRESSIDHHPYAPAQPA